MRLTWLGFVVILLHNVEEALTAPAWAAANAAELRSRFGIARVPEAPWFHLALAAVTIAVLIWIALAARAADRSPGAYSLVVLFAFMFCNALVPHIAGAVLLRRYVPGVLTAALLVVPFMIAWSVDALRTRRVTAGGFAICAVIAAVGYVGIAVRWSLIVGG